MSEYKVCMICNQSLLRDVNFYKEKRKWSSYCKKCHSEYSKEKRTTGVTPRPRKSPPIEGQMYTCPKCNVSKEVNKENFYWYEYRGWLTHCIDCMLHEHREHSKRTLKEKRENPFMYYRRGA